MPDQPEHFDMGILGVQVALIAAFTLFGLTGFSLVVCGWLGKPWLDRLARAAIGESRP